MTNDAVSVRPAVCADASAIRAVCVAGWRTAYADLLPDGYVEANVETFYETARLRREIADPGDAGRWLVAVAETGSAAASVVGAGRGTPPTDGDCEVFTLYVHPDAQGCGVGSELLRTMTACQRAAGGRVQFVDVFADHEGAIGFYESRGFERYETRPADVVDGVDPNHRTVRLSRRIG
ncbi:hypothetical protein C479_13983 [Halovivax asiaticus JCM 14624]|uniref:N-acetyltransferase domain-containing protein n=1 Tax=Halovivax asiaticus JCM 14624 TaxID=1227490 RepID=M0BFN0_9EURY|nr:N-acetyltransferase [Halovivax asiaticus]ELZ08454.1 hypothetical protein C479_13983 [Halovivax asiaticus JCM 14624]